MRPRRSAMRRCGSSAVPLCDAQILGGTGFTTQTELFRLAKVEIDDAVRVLTEVPNLGGAATTALRGASTALADLIATPTVDGRRQKIDNIRTLLVTATSG